MAHAVEWSKEMQKRKDLIVRNLQEVLGDEKLTKQIASGKNIHVYWGTATTGRPHVGYFVPMQKIADLLHAGVRVTILFADLHAFLDNMKSTFVLLENRVLYYERVIKALLTSLDVPIDRLHFVKGSTYQLSEEYTQSVLKLCGCVSQRDALKAGAEVVKQVDSPLLSGLLYPLLQALDEQFLKVDGQIGGVDQRKIFILAEEQLPKLKFGKRFHLMNPMVPGLTGSKMSSSEENTKIDLLDSAESVARKIESAACPRRADTATADDSAAVENGVLSFFRFVVLPILQNAKDRAPIVIDGHTYADFDTINADFESGRLADEDLKAFLAHFLNGILNGVRKKCSDEELQRIIELAYSTPAAELDAGKKTPNSTAGGDSDPPSQQSTDSSLSAIFDGIEVLNSARVRRALAERRLLRVVYRCAVKGRVNFAHIVALLRLRAIRRAALAAGVDCECAVLVSDLSAFLDNAKCPWAAMEGRVKYYTAVLKELMKVVQLENVEIRFSKDFEYSKDYVLDMYKAVSKVTRDESALVPGNSLGTHLCPVYFALDLLHFDGGASSGGHVDAVLIGEDQRKFAELAEKIFQSLAGVSPPSALILPTLVGMDGQRMSATQPDFHLDPLDRPKQFRQKVAKSFCEPGNLSGNVALCLAESVLFPLVHASAGESGVANFIIERSEENGGLLLVANAGELSELFAAERLHPADLKSALVNYLSAAVLEPVQKGLGSETAITKLLKDAFPPAPKGGSKAPKK